VSTDRGDLRSCVKGKKKVVDWTVGQRQVKNRQQSLIERYRQGIGDQRSSWIAGPELARMLKI
jgi:hypothetical protein